jgi:glutathione peroxidase
MLKYISILICFSLCSCQESDSQDTQADNNSGGSSNAGAITSSIDDAGTSDAGTSDAGTSDAGTSDAGTTAGDEAGDEAGEVFIDATDAGDEMMMDYGEPGTGFHAFEMRNIDGDIIDLRAYRGKAVLVVNVASACGFTPQYAGLQTLYEQFQDQNFVILGFPANNFGNQEQGSEEEIKDFCSSTYGVTFPMFAKISVKGDDMHPLYQYLTTESGSDVSWNFNKFLVNPDGSFQAQYLSDVRPESEELVNAIEAILP